MTSPRQQSLYYRQVGMALSDCQLVEHTLKLYLSEAFLYISKLLGHRMPFHYSGDDYEDASLEKLVATFAKLTNNKALVRRLQAFRKERNHLTHQSIAEYFHENADPRSRRKLRQRIKALQREGDQLTEAIRAEADNFRGHLYFDFADSV